MNKTAKPVLVERRKQGPSPASQPLFDAALRRIHEERAANLEAELLMMRLRGVRG